jgi:GGDEF domain-containing protein
VPDPSQPTTPPTPQRPRRTRKFSLPDHHHDERQNERADEHIEAFLATRPRRRRPKASGRVRRPIELDTRPDWVSALRHEAARQERYGRPASVLLIELTEPPRPVDLPGKDGADGGHRAPAAEIDQLARCVADAIRAEARETDRAVRYGASSFRLLLPETEHRAARTVAQRIDRAIVAKAEALGTGARLTIDVVAPAASGTLEDAVAEAERRMATRAADATR